MASTPWLLHAPRLLPRSTGTRSRVRELLTTTTQISRTRHLPSVADPDQGKVWELPMMISCNRARHLHHKETGGPKGIGIRPTAITVATTMTTMPKCFVRLCKRVCSSTRGTSGTLVSNNGASKRPKRLCFASQRSTQFDGVDETKSGMSSSERLSVRCLKRVGERKRRGLRGGGIS